MVRGDDEGGGNPVHAQCSPASAINFYDQSRLYPHHAVFHSMPRRPLPVHPDVITEFTGLRVPRQYDCRPEGLPHPPMEEKGEGALCGFPYYREVASRWFPCYQHEALVKSGQKLVVPDFPVIDEEYAEAVHVYQSVLIGQGVFSFAEFGARWGTWGFRAAAAARAYNTNISRVQLFFVEPEKDGCDAMDEMVELNGFDHAQVGVVIDCADAHASVMTGNFQSWAAERTAIDVLDMDIQGDELEILTSLESVVNDKVKLLIVGTHSAAQHDGVKQLFRKWQVLEDTPEVCNSKPGRCLRIARGLASNPHWENQRVLQENPCLDEVTITPFGPVCSLDSLPCLMSVAVTPSPCASGMQYAITLCVW